MKRVIFSALVAIVAISGAFASKSASNKRTSDYLTSGTVRCMPIPETTCIVGAPNPCLASGTVYDISTPTGCANQKGRF